MIYKKLTELTEKTVLPNDALIHVVFPNDTTQGPEGSSYKMKASALPQAAATINSVLDIGDVNPTTYAGQKGKPLVVNDDEDGVDFGAAQNNIASYFSFGTIEGTGYITTSQFATWLNSQPFALSIAATNTPVVIECFRDINEQSMRHIFLLKNGKGLWGAAGGANTSGTVYSNSFIFISVAPATPGNIEDNPANQIIDLGNLPTGDYLTAANSASRNFSDAGEITENGTKTYYFSYTQDGVLYLVQFVGAAGVYGSGGTPFEADDLIPSTNSGTTPTPTPTWQQTLEQNPVATMSPVIVEGVKQSTWLADGFKAKGPAGKSVTIVVSEPEVDNITATVPAIKANDHFVMRSEVGPVSFIIEVTDAADAIHDERLVGVTADMLLNIRGGLNQFLSKFTEWSGFNMDSAGGVLTLNGFFRENETYILEIKRV